MGQTKTAGRQSAFFANENGGVAASDQSVSSATTGATFVDATGLKFWLEPNEKKNWRMDFRVECGGTGGFKWIFTVPSGASGNATGQGVNNITTNFDSISMTTGKGATTAITSVTTVLALWGSITNGSTAGWVQFQFAQNASNATNTTIRANSIITAWKIGQ